MAEKKFDLIIFGATGFTGKLTARYLTSQYGSTSLKWAIGGRSKAKLEQVKQEWCKGIPDIVIADASDEESVKAMVAQTKVILTAAGPFARYGTPLVAACAELGVDYCDITGETLWVQDMIALYDDKAKESGARIVHHCGHDCVPWDIMTLMLAQKLKENGEDLATVDMYDDIELHFSGGTLETAMGMMFGPEKGTKPKGNLGYNPLLKDGSQKSTCDVDVKNVKCVDGGKDGKPTRSLFVMADVNGNAVKRSNALLKYGNRVTYCEGKIEANKCKAYCAMLGSSLFVCSLACPITRCCVQRTLPKPGEGPSEEVMDAGHLTVNGVGRGVSGGKAEALFYFPVDPGYKDTGRMLSECGLTFVLEKDFKCAGGVYTPAACQGKTLLKRLCDTGSTFKFVD